MMLKRSSLASAFVLVVSACGVFGSEDETPSPAGPGDSTPDAGGAADATINEPPPAPPVSGTVSTDEITEKFGVFVTTTGTPTGEADGSRDRPYATIALGIENGKAKSKRIYVCQGTFKESITLLNQIQLIGGFDCTDGVWKKGDAGAMTRVESPTSPAMIADGLSGATRVQGFDVVAPDGTDATPTSIGLKAKATASLTIANSKITSGKGKDGSPGVNGVQLVLGAAAAGAPAEVERAFIAFETVTLRKGANGGVGSCAGEAGHDGEAGGKGGSGATMQTNAGATAWVVYTSPSPPFLVYNATNGDKTRTGAPGQPGADGASAASPGALTPDGFTPVDGTPGGNGLPGHGGVGGNGVGTIFAVPYTTPNQLGYAGTGPGGGAGGCPGLAGTIGRGGAASIGALLSGSPVTFDATLVVAKDGGAGGKGTLGSSATVGGGAGAVSYVAVDPAGPGGPGGRAGVSGSGAGGSSFGIAHTGGAPQLVNGSTATPGAAGAGVAAQSVTELGVTRTLPASAGGAAKDIQAF